MKSKLIRCIIYIGNIVMVKAKSNISNNSKTREDVEKKGNGSTKLIVFVCVVH